MTPIPPTRREPGRTEDDSQQETGDSIRPSSQRMGGQAPLRPACRQMLFSKRENARAQDNKASRGKTPPKQNATAQKKTWTKNHPNPETKKQPLGRRKHTDQNKKPDFRTQKHGKSQTKTPGGRAWMSISKQKGGLDRESVSNDH